jgi:Family of unknown function (DUF5850)
MGSNNQNIICGLAAISAIIGACLWIGYVTKEKKEKYSSSAFTNIGTFADLGAQPTSIGNNYDMMQSYGTNYNPHYPNTTPWAGTQPSPHNEHYCSARSEPFAHNEYYCGSAPPMESYRHHEHYNSNIGNQLPSKNWNEQRTMARLDRIDNKLLPKTSKNVTPYNVDIADPVAYTFQIHAPRVIRRDRIAMLADPIRGDIPISIYPDVPMVVKSQYDRDSLRLDGTFSDAFAAQYKRQTGGAYFNEPSYNTYGATIMS